ncbi:MULTISPECIES: orotidine-5'-phosphate decarboxylase [Brevibacterium]|uniref:Orotidine-5'-phosphate decarboxylase n=3 Tax=Brevibacterium casei TaxID=33889 RepID=K9B2H7_9MICO|nr:orotidine 5'-phosphate decarboxylase, subfamily 2 [Brevibacterium casei S18]KZE18172.1 orotidine 5'-phosphate decarboxylase [Brevibacterium casei]
MMFGTRLSEAMAAHGPVCVGIDPHDHLLEAWGLPLTAAGVREFALRTVTELAGTVAAVKPQSAFFERFGSAGVAALEETLAACRERGLITILDVKRGDIGSTMAGYAQAHLAPDSPLSADAVTVSPYLGVGALGAAFDLAAADDRGLFVLALTSNPEGASVQHARTGHPVEGFGDSVAGSVAAAVAQANAQLTQGEGLGPYGLVVGATIGRAASELGFDPSDCGGPILAPGVGAQGAGRGELIAVFGREALRRRQIVVAASRAVLAAGPTGLREAAKALNASLTLDD